MRAAHETGIPLDGRYSRPPGPYGGVSILSLLITDPACTQNPLREALRRAGHGHAGVMLALVALRYVDEAHISARMVRAGDNSRAILLPLGFFLSVLDPAATKQADLPGLCRGRGSGDRTAGPRARPEACGRGSEQPAEAVTRELAGGPYLQTVSYRNSRSLHREVHHPAAHKSIRWMRTGSREGV